MPIRPLAWVHNDLLHAWIVIAVLVCAFQGSGAASAGGELSASAVARSGNPSATIPGDSAAGTARTESPRTVVLGDSADPYYGLALEIAENEGILLVNSFDELFEAEPLFVLWVLSPEAISDSLLSRFGIAMRERELSISWGIITGSTIDLARELYERPFSFAGGTSFVDAREETIHLLRNGEEESVPLDGESFARELTDTSYLVFSGHGGSRYWKLSDESRFGAEDIPRLPPVVVTTGACNTFMPWIDGSIALAFADSGAAVYAGFLFSPAPYYLIGHPVGFPLRYTWPDFTIGQVVALQNAGAMKGFAVLPFYHMLGDPRTAFIPEPSYSLVEDRNAGDRRTLTFEDAPAGFLPVRIDGGAAYGFVEIPGVSSSGRQDYFYNSKLQTLRIGEDLFILFEHGGGGFSVHLEGGPNPLRLLTDGLTDVFDHAYIFLPSTNGTTFLLIISSCVLLGAIWFTMRKGLVISGFREALLIGIVFALLKALYALVRIDQASIVSYDFTFNPYFIVGVSVLTGCGALFFLNVRSRFWKAASLLVATFPNWTIAGFWIAGITYINLFAASPHLGTRLYKYSIGLLPAIAFTAEFLVLLITLIILRRRVYREE